MYLYAYIPISLPLSLHQFATCSSGHANCSAPSTGWAGASSANESQNRMAAPSNASCDAMAAPTSASLMGDEGACPAPMEG